MGRLPGGIVDDSRDYIMKELEKMNRSKLLKMSRSSASQQQTEINRQQQPMRDTLDSVGRQSPGLWSRNQSPKIRGFFTANTVRGMRYPLRRVIKTAPRNVLTNPAKEGHFTCTPSTTIGNKTKGIIGEFSYMIEGPEDQRAIPVSFDPPFRFTNPTKKMHGKNGHAWLRDH